MEKEDEYAGGMDSMRRMGDGWKKGWKEECDRWVVPGQSWEGAERLASQGERTHTHTKTTHTHTHVRFLTPLMHILCCQECFPSPFLCQENISLMINRQINGAADMSQHIVCIHYLPLQSFCLLAVWSHSPVSNLDFHLRTPQSCPWLLLKVTKINRLLTIRSPKHQDLSNIHLSSFLYI